MFTVEEGVHKLEILDTSPTDAGEYVVVATNKHGEARCTALVEIEVTPKEPEKHKIQKPEFTEVYQETVSLSSSVKTSFFVCLFVFCFCFVLFFGNLAVCQV